jgi:hypothetical protein
MKKLIILICIFTLTLQAKQTINKGTAYEATLLIKDKGLYLKHNGKTKKLFEGWESSEDEPGMDLEFSVDDINFDGIDDIAVVSMKAYGGVNIYYHLFLSENGQYVESDIELSNYELHGNVVLSEYKSGPRHFTDVYKVNKKHKLVHITSYEKYREDDLCFVSELNLKELNVKKSNGVISCATLVEEHKVKALFAKVIKKKAMLYNNINDEKSNGMYVIKGDKVELIDGKAEADMVLVRFRGKRVVTKYILRSEIEVVE